jgi:ectoine hydroxylase-related dioxygenase (phytanoyl-CoA dioxygenase family)
MSAVLDAAECAAYRERGYVVRPAAFADVELAELAAALERVHDRVATAAAVPGAGVERIDGRRYQDLCGSRVKWEWDEGGVNARSVRSMEPFLHLDPALASLARDPRLVEPMRSLIGGDVDLFTDKLNFKRPGGSPFPWHQDTPYWAFGCSHVERLASVQLYVDAASVENGCLWMVPGSHKQGVLPTYQDRGVLGRLYTDLAHVEGNAEALVAPAGSLIFFDGSVVHGSRSNRSAHSRRAVILTYQPAGHPRWGAPLERPQAPLA